jgi:guanylate kinase
LNLKKMNPTPPKLTNLERVRAGQVAVASRRDRALAKFELAKGSKSIFDLINDPRPSIQKMRVSELLTAVPGIGERRTFLLMQKIGISKGRRIGGLGPKQISALRSEMILNKREASQGSLIVMSGPGGVGKSTITSALRNHPSIWVSISATTREPRESEKDGIDYFFLTDEKFDQMIRNGEFLEWAEFAGNRYGTPKAAVEEARILGKHVLLEIEIAGARQVREVEPKALLVFIAPPSWDELVSRLTNRGTDSPERRAARLALAEEEMAAADSFDHVLVNHSVEGVAEQLLSLASTRI